MEYDEFEEFRMKGKNVIIKGGEKNIGEGIEKKM